jgi:diguanylate cyclase (GGDEF)-like protein
MATTPEQTLNDIFAISEQLYSNMNSSAGGDHSKIFEHLTNLGKILADSDRASFWKWDKHNHTLWTTAATGTDRITIPDTTGLVGKALSEGRVIVTNDPYNDPNFNSEVDKKTGYVTRSILVMPVANIKGEYIGAYQVINKLGGDGKFDEKEDCKKLSLAAMICGLALESDVFLEESYTDKLTKLKNRMGFFADFKKTYDNIIADSNRKLSLFICDIDKFKRVNDTYGHNAGDEVLKHVADIMSANTRECDGMYRWGGEEFIMIMTDTDIKGCADKAETLRKTIEASECIADGNLIKHTMSFGVTEFDPNKTIEENISVADEKLYRAKEGGRNQVIV